MNETGENILPLEETSCSKCKTALKIEVRFCPACGHLQNMEIGEVAISNLKNTLIQLAAFYLLTFLLLLILSAVGITQAHKFQVYADIFYSLFIVAFVIYDYKAILPLLKFNGIRVELVFLFALLSIAFAFLVHYFAEYLNITVFHEERELYHAIFAGTAFPLLFSIISVAVQPAIFEELGFRGFVVNRLNGVTNKEGTIFISAFMFALIHLSVVSLLWLLPIGLFYGYLRIKYNTLWYGIVCHFIHNGTIVLIWYFIG